MLSNIDLLRDLSARYARYLDRREFDKLPDIMTPTVRITLYGGEPETHAPLFKMNGLTEIQQAFQQLHRYQSTFHFVGQQLISELAVDSARGETYCVAYHFYNKNSTDHAYVMYIRYQDRFVRSGGQWKFAERHLIVDRTAGEDVET